ncbi:MAG: 23S rRNA (pseudouridine(1915)-N(3))-methyltransferase RlmH [Alphaproteobacteria bacterium]|nr:23S rRNA (pseudouridine(1915)-N(3))-methyltransferase RlmH [Alphaproteobacteria bacterium]
MRFTIIAVGRTRSGPERTLWLDYLGRLQTPAEVIEVEERKPLPAADRVKSEGRLLLDKIPAGATVIALDGRGQALGSEDLAARLQAWRDEGIRELAFLIGGADGLDRTVIDAAHLVLSLGPMTWPHLLVRVLLAEQLYRAEQILAGHPYHRSGPPPGR